LKYDELLSCFGNRALDLIFNMDTSRLTDNERQMLFVLANRMSRDERLREEITAVIGALSDEDKLSTLLAWTQS